MLWFSAVRSAISLRTRSLCLLPPVDQVTGHRRVAQWESAAVTRPRPQVRTLPRLPLFEGGLLRVPEIQTLKERFAARRAA